MNAARGSRFSNFDRSGLACEQLVAESFPRAILQRRDWRYQWLLFAEGKVQVIVRATERTQVHVTNQDSSLAPAGCCNRHHPLHDPGAAPAVAAELCKRVAPPCRSADGDCRNGIADTTTMLGAAEAELDARLASVQPRQALAQARISLYKSMDGGWSESERAGAAPAGR